MRLLLILICLGLFSCGVKNKVLTEETTTKLEVENDDTLEAQVRKCFYDYKTAILNDKGHEAVEFVDSRTIKYYSDMLHATLVSDSTEVKKLNIMDRLMVFSMRHRTSKEELLGFDGKQLLTYAIKEGMIGKNSVANTDIGEVIEEEDYAKGQMISNGMPAPVYFHFYKEEARWKIDLTSIFPMATAAFENMAKESEYDENEYIFMLLEMITGEAPTDKIWETIK